MAVLVILIGLSNSLLLAASAEADRILLRLSSVPTNGLVVTRVDLGAAAEWCKVEVQPEKIRAFARPGEIQVPAQFVPDEGQPAKGVLVLKCDPSGGPITVGLDFSGTAAPANADPTMIRTRSYSAIHDPKRQGGLPAEIGFSATEKQFSSLRWNDRLYHRELGQFWLRYDKEARVRCVSTGPLCTVVRVSSRYCQPDGTSPASQPAATYDWWCFKDLPWIFVRAVARQTGAQAWHEAHFLELNFPDDAFPRWAGGEPPQEGAFAGNDQSQRFAQWGALIEGQNAIGMAACAPVLVYDGKGYGRYLHADSDAAWQGWNTTEFERTAWLWIGADDQPIMAISRWADTGPTETRALVTVDRLDRRIEALRAQLSRAKKSARQQAGWELAVLRWLQNHGRIQEALEWTKGQVPAEWTVLPAGDLRMILQRVEHGWKLVNLADAGTGELLLTEESLPLFEVTLRHTGSGEEVRVVADEGWGEASLDWKPGMNSAVLRWAKPQLKVLGNVAIEAKIGLDEQRHRLTWNLEARNQADPWSLWKVRFPQLALGVLSERTQLLLPQAAGVLKPVGRERLARFHGDYPSGWMSMQVAAVYDEDVGTGLYQALHDPTGAIKEFSAQQESGSRAVTLAWDLPASDMGRTGNVFRLPGVAVWQLLRGDWFDAAVIYRDWVRKEARWHPALGADGRKDTPPWMRELCAWALTGGGTNECVSQVLEFARALDVPIGFHWYNWHQIPFDNDYPHYFPTRPGFAEGVKELQSAGVMVMPYINGRLWDTQDQGTNDFEFTKIAQPATTKNQEGKPYTETYGSKEANGEKVTLAVMCPTTPTWQNRQRDIVLRLFGECGVKGVYMDQIAAAKPVLCFDDSHRHPLGGGAWWNELGYWPLLDRIRESKPADRMLTTECNAEPFIRWFDGYLTWHWQYDGQVPLFPAVYGGAIQMFGRAYRGGPTKDLALRMKAAQQLVYGEQLGWMHPNVVREQENFALFRDAVRLRWNLRRYFYAGQMARPPSLEGPIPEVTADWQWSGVWPVTTPALMSGAWHIPAENRLVLLFANVSDEAVSVRVTYDLRNAGLNGKSFARQRVTSEGRKAEGEVGENIHEAVTFLPRGLWAWELTGK